MEGELGYGALEGLSVLVLRSPEGNVCLEISLA